MKILQVNCVYNEGSTGKIVNLIHKGLLSEGFESIVCYGRGADTTDVGVYRICGELYAKANKLLSQIVGLPYGGCHFSTSRLISIIKREKPDVVHLHCINGNFVNIYRLVAWLNKNKIKTVLTLHAEFMFTANCSHSFECEAWLHGCKKCSAARKELGSRFFDRTKASWRKMARAFDGFEDLTIVSVSPWLKGRAERSPILNSVTHTAVFNGVNTDAFYPHPADDLGTRLGLDGKQIVFHATPMFSDKPDHLKGGYHILKLAERMLKTNPDVRFVVAGRCDPTAEIPENVILLGNVTDNKMLSDLYSLADVTVIASRRETFSMIVAESLCCGTPVVGFKAGGPESIAIPEYTSFVDYGNTDALFDELNKYINKKDGCPKASIATRAKETYSEEKMVNGYISTYLKKGGDK